MGSTHGPTQALSQTVKYLGIHFDSKLSWNTHLQATTSRAKAAFWTLRGCFGATWGLKPKVVIWLYKTIIRPMLSYGCLIWWKRAQLLTSQNLLNKFQRLICTAATGAIKSTPTTALEVLLYLPPLHLFLKNEASLSALRLKQNKSIDLRRHRGHATTLLQEKWCQQLEMPVDRILRQLMFEMKMEPIFPTREEWDKSEVPKDRKKDVIFYTDGSYKDGKAGAGIFCGSLDIAISIPLGNLATVFQAELLAIIEALHICEELENRNIAVCSDSQSVIKALSSPLVISSLVKECKILFNSVSRKNSITLFCVPGHSGINGNEEADILAKAGSELACHGPEPILPISWSMIRKAAAENLHQKFKVFWEEANMMTHSKRCIYEPSQAYHC